MKRVLFVLALSTTLFACNDKEEQGKFKLNGTVKNVADQSVYLEQLFFTQQEPQVLDTGEIKAMLAGLLNFGPSRLTSLTSAVK